MKNDASVQRLLKDKRGNAVINFTGKSARELFERKTTITDAAVGTASPGCCRSVACRASPWSRARADDQGSAYGQPDHLPGDRFCQGASAHVPGLAGGGSQHQAGEPGHVHYGERASQDHRHLDSRIPSGSRRLQRTDDFHPHDDAVLCEPRRRIAVLSGDNVGEDLHGLDPAGLGILHRPPACHRRLEQDRYHRSRHPADHRRRRSFLRRSW